LGEVFAEPNPQGAIGRANEFLIHYELPRLPKYPTRVTYSGILRQPVFSITTPQVYFEFETISNRLVEVLDLNPSAVESQGIEIQPQPALSETTEFLSHFQLLPDDAYLALIELRKPRIGRWFWLVKWDHIVSRYNMMVPVRDETLHVDIDTENRRVLNFYGSVWSRPDSFELSISPEKALKVSTSILQQNVPQSKLSSVRIGLEFIHPNMYWEAVPARPEELSLAWIVRIETMDEKSAEFWIDARTGDCVGGDRTRP